MDVFKQTLKADGFRGLYRGMATPLVGVTPIFAVSFWAYDMGKKIVYAATPSRTSQDLTIPELAFAGFFSAIPTTLLMSPSERIKVVLQVYFLWPNCSLCIFVYRVDLCSLRLCLCEQIIDGMAK